MWFYHLFPKRATLLKSAQNTWSWKELEQLRDQSRGPHSDHQHLQSSPKYCRRLYQRGRESSRIPMSLVDVLCQEIHKVDWTRSCCQKSVINPQLTDWTNSSGLVAQAQLVAPCVQIPHVFVSWQGCIRNALPRTLYDCWHTLEYWTSFNWS